MLVGSIWYAPQVFGNTWKKLVKLDEKKMKSEAGKAYIGMLILSLISSYVIAHVAYLSSTFYNVSLTQAGITTGLWLWVGIALPVIAGNGMFEQRPKNLILLNVGNQLVTMVLVGFTIGAIGV
jgi:hypothetical protein